MDGKRGGRTKPENLIPIADIQARGLWEFSIHFGLPNMSRVMPLEILSNVHIGEGCGSLQNSPSSPGLHLLALEPGPTSAIWGCRR